MPQLTACTSCSAKIKVKDELIGKSIKCPKCAKVFKASADGEVANAAVQAGAALKPTPKKPPPPVWDKGDEDDGEDEKSSPWDSKGGSKAGEKKRASTDDDKEDDDDTPKSKSKAPPKRKSRDDEDEEDDDEDEGDKQENAFESLLDQTLLSDSTKKMIQGEMGLREHGVWVGQPDLKMATAKGFGHAVVGAFVISILCAMLGGGGGSVLGDNWLFAAGAAVLLWIVLVPIVAGLVIFLDRKKAKATAYVITNKRCISFTGGWFMGPSQESFYPDLVAHMRRISSWFFGTDAGSIVFRSVTTITTTHSRRHGTSTSVSTVYYGFLGIRNLDQVEQTIRNALFRDDDDDDDDDEDDRRRRKKRKKKKRRDDDDDDD